MSDIIEELVAAVGDACTKYSDADAVSAAPAGSWNSRLWTALDQIGVTMVAVAEENGGAGGDVSTAVAVLEVLGQFSARVPLAETALLAGWLLAGTDAVLPTGPMTACLAGPDLRIGAGSESVAVSGTIARVPWARCAGHVVVLDGRRVLVLRRGDFAVSEGINLAGEPRDDVLITATVPAAQIHDLPPESEISAQNFRNRSALARAALTSGAARRALELSITYAGQREQFGRPIAKFQAIQQHLASMAAETLLSKVAVEAAALIIDAGGDAAAVAAAKIVTGQAAGLVSALAHQIHGALGYTEEHSLRLSTTRLWAWRDEIGNEEQWSGELGQRALSAGTAGLWQLVTGIR
ncbi:acyl-CoA dehydrogenase [Nocardia speluncae]|uniref:Acyl-CoA dehydrogenase n=1 Tax=Nocardia speluncae TaxID=419477 RepID=A0A846XDN1_9NOCA|nr:acyl-CoA dehydrogenase [Nocardia speluncae]NKY32806.1 acyl-CoA dehydrogenase [Nocardia speluncae]